MEVWRPVPGYEGLYEVSDLGQVRRCKNHRLVKVFFSTTVMVALFDGHNHKRRLSLSALVAQTFLPERPKIPCRLIHRDGDAFNNAAANLEWHIGPDKLAREQIA